MLNFIFAAILACFLYVAYQKYTRRKLPPGPVPLPLVGNLIEIASLGGAPHEALLTLSKKYGELMSLQVGVVPTVVISGTQMIRAALKTEEFDNRIDYEWVLDRSYGKQIGIIFSANNFWKDVRRLTHSTLKDFGFGKGTTMEMLILDEFDIFFKSLRKKVASDSTLHISTLFNGPMANIMWMLVTGTRFDLEDENYQKLVEGVNEFMKCGQLGGSNLLGAYPFLIHYLPDLTGFTHLHNTTIFVQKYFEKLVQEHKDRGEYKKDPRNFIDKFLAVIEENKDSSNTIYTQQNLISIVNDLFLAGSETSGNGSAFAVRLMVQYPEIQRKVQAELDRVIGRDRHVEWSDKPKLHYCDATVLEILRFTGVAPLGPRRAHNDIKFGPYEIPAGTTVLVNFYSAAMEDSVWGDPRNFRPERFLNENGDITNTDKFLIFGSGKRNCIGEVAARISFFLAFTNLLHNFHIDVDPKTGMPGNDVLCGFTVTPKPFNVTVRAR